jgi:hypothetical protein
MIAQGPCAAGTLSCGPGRSYAHATFEGRLRTVIRGAALNPSRPWSNVGAALVAARGPVIRDVAADAHKGRPLRDEPLRDE